MLRTLIVSAVDMVSGAAYADDPTGVLLRVRSELRGYAGDSGASYVGPLGPALKANPPL